MGDAADHCAGHPLRISIEGRRVNLDDHLHIINPHEEVLQGEGEEAVARRDYPPLGIRGTRRHSPGVQAQCIPAGVSRGARSTERRRCPAVYCSLSRITGRVQRSWNAGTSTKPRGTGPPP